MTDNTKQYIEIENIGYDRDDDAVVIYLNLRTYRDYPLNDVTYPSCAVKFDKIPDKVKIRSYDGNTYLFGGYISDTDAWGLDVAIDPDYTAVFQSGHKSTYVYEIEDGKYRYILVNSSRASHQHPNQRDFVKGSGTVDSIAALKSVCTRFGTFDEVMVKGDEENRIKAEDYIKMLTGIRSRRNLCRDFAKGRRSSRTEVLAAICSARSVRTTISQELKAANSKMR